MTTEYNSGSADGRFDQRLADMITPVYDSFQSQPLAILHPNSGVGPEGVA
jgi:hypothetical protein